MDFLILCAICILVIIVGVFADATLKELKELNKKS